MNSIKLLAFLFLAISCKMHNEDNSQKHKESFTNGDTVEITGIAYDRKGGAIIDYNGTHYWIEGKESWEDIYQNKILTINGILEKRADNPVFLDTSDFKKQGIPVYSEAELQANQYRIWIKNITIKLVK